MPIIYKSRRDVDMMRRAGAVVYSVLQKMKKAAIPGAATEQLDELVRVELENAGAVSLSKDYKPDYKVSRPYPSYSCLCVNEVVVHGIAGPQKLKNGDVITLDLALSLDGYCADSAITVGVGQISPKSQKLLDVTKGALDLAVHNIKPGKLWSQVAYQIQTYVEKHGFNVVRDFVGHGIGASMHELPQLPNFVTPQQLKGDFRIKAGMTLAVEPMVVMGKPQVATLPDGWTIVTMDRQPAAHFEHTVAVTETGVDILTDGKLPAAVNA